MLILFLLERYILWTLRVFSQFIKILSCAARVVVNFNRNNRQRGIFD